MKYLSLFKYFDYRLLLKDYYTARKSADVEFSYRNFAQTSNIKSLGLYQRLVKGEVRLSESSFPKISLGLGLESSDSEAQHSTLKSGGESQKD